MKFILKGKEYDITKEEVIEKLKNVKPRGIKSYYTSYEIDYFI